MKQAHYSQVVPNSHRWTDLNQVLTTIKYDEIRRKSNGEKYSTSEPLTVEYLLIGFKNVKYARTRLVFNSDFESLPKVMPTIFTSIEAVIKYLQSYMNESREIIDEWSIDIFKEIIEDTIKCGFNLKQERKMERREVYKCLDTERDYQDLRWTPRREKNDTPDEQKPPAEWLNYMQKHVNLANDEVYNLNDEKVLAHIRKVAALAVRCLELYGCPERIIPADLLVKE